MRSATELRACPAEPGMRGAAASSLSRRRARHESPGPGCCHRGSRARPWPGGSVSGVEPARLPDTELDAESAGWLRRLGAGEAERWAAKRELHAKLVRIALAEVQRRQSSTPVTGPELDDIAHQAAADAMLAILAKLEGFRARAGSPHGLIGSSSWRSPANSAATTGATRRSSSTPPSGSASPTGSAWTRNGTRRRQESSPRYAASSTTS